MKNALLVLWLVACGLVALWMNGYVALGALHAERGWLVLVVLAAAVLGGAAGLSGLTGTGRRGPLRTYVLAVLAAASAAAAELFVLFAILGGALIGRWAPEVVVLGVLALGGLVAGAAGLRGTGR